MITSGEGKEYQIQLTDKKSAVQLLKMDLPKSSHRIHYF